ncbi:response regulator [Streptomyces sp. NPDC050560]|uniref:response regulator n=1 Tax=Streptomyces sp. NPDC050560 TaxID=3365630 RepID=UPI0037A146D5
MADVLLLEDNGHFARAVRRALTGHRVTHVRTVQDAMTRLEAGGFDCALIDLNLTDQDDYSGYEVLSFLMRTRPELPRAVVTGSRLKGSIYKNILLRYGVADVVIKGDVERRGYGTTDIVETVEALLAGAETKRRDAARSEIREARDTARALLDERLVSLQQFAEQVGGRRPRRDATARRRSAVLADIEAIDGLAETALAACRDAPVADLVDHIRAFRRQVKEMIGDA